MEQGDVGFIPRWYMSPFGRVVRALLGVPFLALAFYLFSLGGIGLIGAALCLYLGLSLPWAAVVQEPD